MDQKGRVFEWEALEYPHHERSVDWYWGLGLTSAAIAVVAIFLDNPLFAVLVITGAIAIGILALREPKPITYRVTDKTVEIGEKKIWYTDIESFYVSEREDDVKLILGSKHFFTPYIIIPIFDHDPDVLRAFLLRKLPEVEHHEPILNVIIERLGL